MNILRKFCFTSCFRPFTINYSTSQNTEKLTKEMVRRIVLEPDALKTQHPDYIPLERTKFKKHALLLSYCGKNYFGLQLMRGYNFRKIPTIEGYLFYALAEAQLIEQRGRTVPQLYDYSRGSRTDKGVSAVRQVASLFLPTHIPHNEMKQMINQHLPEDIRIMGVSRVPADFCPRLKCNNRSYSYLCPSYAFAPFDSVANQHYRITDDVLKKINQIFELFTGQHKFHNYTSKKYFRHKSSIRRMISIKTDPPFLREGHEWIRILITGDSFMLHQIRKMIGMTIAICRNIINEDLINTSYQNCKINVPRAPALGLVLESQNYETFKTYRSCNKKQILNWGNVNDEIIEFRSKYIDSNIISEEMSTYSMLKWLESLPISLYVPLPEELSHEAHIYSPLGHAWRMLMTDNDRLLENTN